MGRFKSNTIPPRQQWKTLPRVRLEHFPVIQLARPDNEPEISTLGKSLLEKLVDPVLPVAPMFKGWPAELRRKFAQFKHELAEDGRRDGRERSEAQRG